MPTADSFRSRLVSGEPLYGAWSVLASPLSVRLLAAAGATDGVTAPRYRDAGCTLITTTADAVAITRDTAAQLSHARA